MQRLHEGFLLGGRYRLASRIAAGGMGDVWRAADGVLGRTVAVKIMRPSAIDERVFIARFRAEARLAAQLHHPNIATVFDYGEDEDLAFLVMELVDGAPLSDLLRRGGRLASAQVRSIMGQAAMALAVAHQAGVVHRDVKPANVLITADGTVKLTDFGIARATDGSSHTRTGEILGTPYYLSPEQALGQPATGASDIYALGVLAHEMLSGRRPFDRGTPVATVLSHVNEPPPALPADVDADLAEVIDRCLEKDPADRPESALALATLLGFRTEPVAVVPSDGFGASSAVHEATPKAPATDDVTATDESTGVWKPSWTNPGVPLRDLEQILAHLSPQLHEGIYAVVSVPEPVEGAHPFMTLQEEEGLTMLLRMEEAQQLGLDFELPLAWITLGAYRAIGSVGLVASATTALTQAHIPAVAGVGRWHTHLFVPAADSERAMKVLHRLSAAHQDL